MRLCIIGVFIALFLTSCIERVQEKKELTIYGSQEILVADESGEEVIKHITLQIDS
ncbi:MAG: hypothetical protein ACJAWO_001433, partial [Halieaceae bacterium]